MSTYMHIDVTDTTATKETEIQFNRSKLPVSDEVRAIDRELEADPSNCELWMRRGIALSKQMLFKEAVESYSKDSASTRFTLLPTATAATATCPSAVLRRRLRTLRCRRVWTTPTGTPGITCSATISARPGRTAPAWKRATPPTKSSRLSTGTG